MPGIEEFHSEALELGSADQLDLIVVNNKVLTGIYQSEVLSSLYYEVNAVLHIKHKWTSPVHHIVHIALGSSADNKMVVSHAHINHSFSKVQVFIHLMKAVINRDLVVLVQNSLNMSPGQLAVNDVAKDY